MEQLGLSGPLGPLHALPVPREPNRARGIVTIRQVNIAGKGQKALGRGPSGPPESFRNRLRLPQVGDVVWPLHAHTGDRVRDDAGPVVSVFTPPRGPTQARVEGYRDWYAWYALEYPEGRA